MTAINDIWEKKYHISAIKRPLTGAGEDIEGIEVSIQSCKETLERHTDQTIIEEAQHILEQQEPKLAKLRQLKERLDEGLFDLERKVSGARAHADWALETAMEIGNLLRSRKPFHPPAASEIVDAYGNSPRQDSVASTRSAPGSEEMRRREADDDVSVCGYELHKVQAEFNNREHTYYKELAGYQRGLKDGTYDFSRTEFDGRMLAYGRDITRELIEAEENYERAKARREALGVRSSCDQSSLQSCRGYEESMSKDEVAVYVSSLDRSSIEAWRADIPMSGIPEENQMMSIDDLDAGLVQISDSASAADDGAYTKLIDRWQKVRGVYEGTHRPRTNDIWTRDVET